MKLPAKRKAESIFDLHQTRIALKTLRLSDVGAWFLGGMDKEQARAHLTRMGWSVVRVTKHEESE